MLFVLHRFVLLRLKFVRLQASGKIVFGTPKMLRLKIIAHLKPFLSHASHLHFLART